MGNRESQSELAEAILQQALDSGSYYPEEVPWVTARVLIALGRAGYSLYTTPKIRQCVDWLLRPVNEGGACEDGIWTPNTGDWNTITETVSMVLIALSSVGFSSDDSRLAIAKNQLIQTQNFWMEEGRELDATLAIRALIETGTSWDYLSESATILGDRALKSAVWNEVVSSAAETLKQSCRTAQIASDLVKIAVAALRMNLSQLLNAIDFEEDS
jgi:hypothetical protein